MTATSKPPVSISIVSWYLIGSSALSLIYVPMSLSNPAVRETFRAFGTSVAAVLLIAVCTLVLNLVAGLGMLRAKRWGRNLYIVGGILSLALSLVLYGSKMLMMTLVGTLIYGFICLLLTRPAAASYFAGFSDTAPESPAGSPNAANQVGLSGKRIGAILLLLPGGWLLITLCMTIVPLAEDLMVLTIAGGIFGILACAFIIPAVFLWGRQRWAGFLGMFLVCVGVILIFIAVIFDQLSTLDEVRVQFATVNPEILSQMIRGSFAIGAASGIVGGLLILLQRMTDKEKKPETVTVP